MRVSVLSESGVLAEFIGRPLRSAGHTVAVFEEPAVLTTAMTTEEFGALFLPRHHRSLDVLGLLTTWKSDPRTRVRIPAIVNTQIGPS